MIRDTREKLTVCGLSVRLAPQFLRKNYLDLTEPVDIYSEWIDAADAAQKDTHSALVGRLQYVVSES